MKALLLLCLSFEGLHGILMPSQLRGQAGSKNKSSRILQGRAGDDNKDLSVNQQILEALKSQTSVLKSQNRLLKSIDARLGRIEKHKQAASEGRGLYGRSLSSRPSRSQLVTGSWKFVESDDIEREQASQAKSIEERQKSRVVGYRMSVPSSFGRIDCEGLSLVGESFPQRSGHRHHPSTVYQSSDTYTPEWSTNNCRLLPQLVFDTKVELGQKTGIYSLAVKFSKTDDAQDAGIIVGEMEFNDKGYVMAEGADWDRLLNNQRQTMLPYANGARGVPIWLRRKLTEPWEDGDVLKFRIDTNENTVVFQRGDMPEKALRNVLAFTNNRQHPEFLRAFAYCGSFSENLDVKLTIV